MSIEKQAKRYGKKLLDLSGGQYYEVFRVDQRIFTEKDAAIFHARKVARVRGDAAGLWRIKVPQEIPEKYVAGYLPSGKRILDQPDVLVYVVDGGVFTDWNAAYRAAQAHAETTGFFVPIYAGKVVMGGLEMIDGADKPDESKTPVKAPAA